MLAEESTNEKTKEEEPIKEEYDFNNPSYSFIPNGNHEWRQQGFYLVCYSCELQHATFIGKEKMLVGIKEGKPIIKDRKELGMV